MQVLDCYLVLESDKGLVIVDQHALHERVLYEQFRGRVLSGKVESQKLLVPQTVEMSLKETALLLSHRELLAELGFGVEEFGHGTILLTADPALLPKADHVKLLRDVVDQLDQPGQAPTRRDLLEQLLSMMACKAAIKAGHRLSVEEMERLLAYRPLIEDSHQCPHGRPTALVLSREALDRQFGRLG
jgi:DNA mismatch repair protein MutL